MGAEWSTVAVPAGLVVVTLALLASRTLRADGVAVLALVAAVVAGLIPAGRALAGLADPVVVTIAALAVLAGAVHRSGVVEIPRTALIRRWRLTTPVLLGSGFLVALLAAVSGRVGTRAALMRNARLPDEAEASVWPLLMLDLACLLGGTVTVAGGVPNLLVSAVRADRLGTPFSVLAFFPAGALLLGVGLLLFAIGSAVSRSATGSRAGRDVDPLRRVKSFAAEIVLPPGSPLAGRPIAALEAAAENSFHVVALVREGYRRIDARPDWPLLPGDVLMLDCEPAVLHRLVERFGLQPADGPFVRPSSLSSLVLVEAVVTQSSLLIGQPASASFGATSPRAAVHLLGIGRNDDHSPARLRRIRLRAGDIIVFAAETDTAPATLTDLGCLSLAERRLRLGRRQLAALPLAILLLALALAATGAFPLWLALLSGIVVLVFSQLLTLREIYDAVPWPGLVMVASLLPLAASLHAAAPAAAAVHWLAPHAAASSPALVVAVTLALTMVAATLFGAVVTVLLLAPFALSLAAMSGLPGDMLLIAIAIGAAVDTLATNGVVATLVPAPNRHFGPPWGKYGAVVAFLLVCGTAIIAGLWHA